MYKPYISFLLALLALVCLAACEDDLRYEVPVVDGSKSTINVSVEYSYEADVDLKSRAYYEDAAAGGDAGTSIQNINELWMVIFDSEGSFLCKYPVLSRSGASKSGPMADSFSIDPASIKNEENIDNRLPAEKTSIPPLGDDKAGRVTYNITMPTGRYFIYAVANVDKFEEKEFTTREDLKALKFNWNPDDISKNSQMFGIFSADGPNREQTDDSHIVVSNKVAELHAWVRRLASKVTVAFDGSRLYDNVQVIIYDIAIKDIPKQAYLGYANRPGWEGDVRGTQTEPDSKEASANRYTAANGLYPDGKKITIQPELTDAQIADLLPTNYLHVCNSGHPYLGKGEEGADKAINDKAHAHTARSLFFYENMQGTGKNKQQPHPDDSTKIWYPNPSENDLTSGWKDHKPYGTYIEVSGYYRNSSNNEFVSSGPIKYRFMLGQNTSTDYDAVRNAHYKLTLVLKGNGNDADWHIDYKEKVGLHISSPQFISYLYNKDMNLTVKMSGELDDSYYLRAEIIGTDDKEIKYKHGKNNVPTSMKDKEFAKRFVEKDELEEQTYWRPWGDGSEDYPDPKDHKDPQTPSEFLYYHGDPTVPNDPTKPYYGPWVSFLSLRKTQLLQVDGKTTGYYTEDVGGSDKQKMYDVNHRYFNDKDRGWRNFHVAEGIYTDAADGNYKVAYTKKKDDGTPVERVFSVPLYTRSKELVSTSGFVGNNPYTSYPRRQRVKIYVASNEDGTAVEGIDPVYVDIIQVRRIVNPKAVWRSGDTKPEDFHVTLMWLKEDDEQDMSKSFEAFESMGPWSAEIVNGGDNIVSLSTTSEGSGANASQSGVRRIEGASEHKIDFKINFTGGKGCAIVKVRYHNYTCEHDIFCRVGYEAIALEEGKAKWNTRNVEYFDNDGNAVLCASPLMEGSLFRHRSTTAILASNNTVDQFSKAPAALNVKKQDGTTTTMEWKDIMPNYDDPYWTINNDNEYVATYTDFNQLRSQNNSDIIKKAYGVMYGDGATNTAQKMGDAYGYDGTDRKQGMRGVIVYNVNTHAQIFFPIGKSGYGQRKASGGWGNSDPAGALKYASRSIYYNNKDLLPYVPLFCDIYRRTGAIYWCRYCNEKGNKGKNTAFDMNYHTMAFKTYEQSATASGLKYDNNNNIIGVLDGNGDAGNACFLRTIVGTPPDEPPVSSAIKKLINSYPPPTN